MPPYAIFSEKNTIVALLVYFKLLAQAIEIVQFYMMMMNKRIVVSSITFVFLLSGQLVSAQGSNEFDVNFDVNTNREAQYHEGDQKLYEHMFYNLKYSDEAREAKVIGQVMVSFKVQPDGSLTDMYVVSGVGHGIDEEVVKVLKGLKFLPAIQNGHKIATTLMMSFPISAT